MMLREGTLLESKILGTSLFPCFYVFRCLSLESRDVKNHIVTIEKEKESGFLVISRDAFAFGICPCYFFISRFLFFGSLAV
ncbi:unnamed protein product [Arabidopsis halleri]